MKDDAKDEKDLNTDIDFNSYKMKFYYPSITSFIGIIVYGVLTYISLGKIITISGFNDLFFLIFGLLSFFTFIYFLTKIVGFFKWPSKKICK